MIFYDVTSISKRHKTPEGFLEVPAKLARIGIQEYDAVRDFAPGELPADIPVEPGRRVRLLRPEDEVFSDAMISSCRSKPITDGHPPGGVVTNENVKDLQVGFSRDKVTRDGDNIAAELLIQVKDAIDKIEKTGVNQISLGYATDVQWSSGEHETFGVYDGIQTNIRCNHIAIVPAGRAGPEVRLSDSKTNQAKKEISKMATRLFDGITIEVTDQAGEAIDKMSAQIVDAKSEVETLTKQVEDANSKAEKLAGELDAEKAKTLDVKAIDAMIEARVELIDAARKLAPKMETKCLNDTEIRRAAIGIVSDKFDLVDKSDEYVEAVFDTLVNECKPNESAVLGDDLKNLDDSTVDPADKARDAMCATRNGGK